MKILLIVITYPPVLNSAARLFSELAEYFVKGGHKVTVLTTYPERYIVQKNPVPFKQINHIEVLRLKNLSFPKHVPFFRGLEHIIYAIQYYLKGRRLKSFDSIIAYSPPLTFGMVAIFLARKWKGKAIINVQDIYPQTAIDLGLLKNKLLIRMAKKMETWVYQNAHAITVHSEGNRAHVISHGASPEKVWVIPNWVNLELFRPGPKDNGFRRQIVQEKCFIVSYAGIMGFAQGISDILEAASIVSKKTSEVIFLLAGEGVMVPQIKKMVNDLNLSNVKFLPHLPEEKYIALLQASDACFVTLHKDLKTPVVPGKLPCVMGVGRPVICSTPPESDARSIIEKANCGYWIPAGSTKSLADAIIKLFEDTFQAERMGINGRKYAEEHFDKQKCLKQYEMLLDFLNKQSC
ncbi:MAG: glycosyltransferase family 4 protein [Candidatus Omnitrophica bacterium]|nr:glycosyltransferase family 4 protein [Candidatus Omnitrophota bacterium]